MSSPGASRRFGRDRRKAPPSLVRRFALYAGIALGLAAEAAFFFVRRVRLAHDLGLEVIAEGVEDAACSRHLVEIGCELAQGFYFGRPMPAADVAGAVAR